LKPFVYFKSFKKEILHMKIKIVGNSAEIEVTSVEDAVNLVRQLGVTRMNAALPSQVQFEEPRQKRSYTRRSLKTAKMKKPHLVTTYVNGVKREYLRGPSRAYTVDELDIMFKHLHEDVSVVLGIPMLR